MSPKLLIAFLLLPFSFAQAIPEIAGPITGDVRANQVTLWMYAPAKSKCTFSYRAEGSSKKDKQDGQTHCPIQPGSKSSRANIQIDHEWSVSRYPLPVRGFHRWSG